MEGWTPVEQYTGGAEHAVMHLLYAREFTKMMRDLGLIQQDEPWRRVFNQGQILGTDGERMSKSRGNIQDPDELVSRYGADAVRLFLMFMGPWDQGGPWSPSGIGGVHRFLNRVWTLAIDPLGREHGDPDAGHLPAGESEDDAARAIRAAAHRTLRDVTEDYEGFRFNTMVAKLMELSNTLFRYRGTPVAGGEAWDEAMRLLLLMLAPAAPHITEEIWSRFAGGRRPPVGLDPHRIVAAGRRVGDGRIDARGAGPGQRQAARPDRGGSRRLAGRRRGRGPRQPEDRGAARRPHAGQDHRGRRRQAHQHRPARRLTADPGRPCRIDPRSSR